MAEQWSVVVYPNNCYRLHMGNWEGMHSDGRRPCEFVSVHPSFHAALKAKQSYDNPVRPPYERADRLDHYADED